MSNYIRRSTIRIDESLLDTLEYIAEADGRTKKQATDTVDKQKHIRIRKKIRRYNAGFDKRIEK